MSPTVGKFRLTRTGIVVINVQQAAMAAAAASCVRGLSIAQRSGDKSSNYTAAAVELLAVPYWCSKFNSLTP
jgi:hypothetical protein